METAGIITRLDVDLRGGLHLFTFEVLGPFGEPATDVMLFWRRAREEGEPDVYKSWVRGPSPHAITSTSEWIDVAVLASGARLSPKGIAFNAIGRRAILVDPGFSDGDYHDHEDGPKFGLALARMVAHGTYLSETSIEMKFGRRLQEGDRFAYDVARETEFQVESYLHHQGKQFVERFDANSYLYLTRAMDYFDLAASHGSLCEALGRSDARYLVVSYSTDWLFPTSQSREVVSAMVEAQRDVTMIELQSPYGHDAFLIEHEQLAGVVVPFLEQTLEAARGRS